MADRETSTVKASKAKSRAVRRELKRLGHALARGSHLSREDTALMQKMSARRRALAWAFALVNADSENDGLYSQIEQAYERAVREYSLARFSRKGGRARAAALPKERRSEIARIAGLAWAAKTPAVQRSESARRAALARAAKLSPRRRSAIAKAARRVQLASLGKPASR